MGALVKRPFIRQRAQENQHDHFGKHIFWSRHAIAEAINDNLSRSEIELALVTVYLPLEEKWYDDWRRRR